MSTPYTGFSTLKTPQSQPIPFSSTPQVKNSAGGFVYELDKWGQLERFLILGSEGGTYYVSERSLTKDNAHAAVACIQEDGKRAVDLVVAISDAGRAPKNDPALFVLALASASPDVETRQYALSKLSKVARIPTHLFHFVEMVKQHRGFGPTLHKALQRWYSSQDVDKLAYEMVKYQQRDGWSHRDILRKARPKVEEPIRNSLYKWATSGWDKLVEAAEKKQPYVQPPFVVGAFEQAKKATNTKELVDLIQTYNLSREMLPTEALKFPEVWEALLEKMPLHAMVRNLGNLSKCGLLKPLSDAEKLVCSRLRDERLIKKSRLHPYAILVAAKTYAQGKGILGKGEWLVSQRTVDALDDSFELSFNALEPTGKRFLIGDDVSGSMRTHMISSGQKDKYGSDIPGPISAAEGAAALSLAIARVEPECYIHGFTSSHGRGYYDRAGGDTSGFIELGITAKTKLKDAATAAYRANFGATDCSVPALWALKNKIAVDCIVIITDNETWSGQIHPSQALKEYRRVMGIPVRQVVIGMTSTGFTIADPADPLSLDVVGFDANVPAIIQDFVRG